MKGIKTPTEFICWMWESDQFNNDLSLWDIENFAKSKGYAFTKPAIRMALKRSNFITTVGRLSNGVPLFRQVYPPTSIIDNDDVPRHIRIFETLDLHSEIKRVCSDLFHDGHYAQAIGEAFKKINNMVKTKSEKYDLDGRKLMQHVFSPNSPILKINHGRSQSEKDEQEGFMYLFAGSIQGIRNPKAHDEIIQEDPYKTIEYLCFASLLAKTIDTSTK